MIHVDVLCVGASSFDMTLQVSTHPAADEKTTANSLLTCGGGPAANAAVTVTRLGGTAAYVGYLGTDVYGDRHLAELKTDGVVTDFIVRSSESTPLSVVLAKPNGERTLVNYRGAPPLPADSIDLTPLRAKVMLADGHEPELSLTAMKHARAHGSKTVLDAGSVKPGTLALADQVDYLVCSELFAQEFTGESDMGTALLKLTECNPNVVITLGAKGLIWKTPHGEGSLQAYRVNAIDTTGAGDAFHGAFALGVAQGMAWRDLLNFSSAVAALSTTQVGARIGLPYLKEVDRFLGSSQIHKIHVA
ncbi:MAG: carbohydrate kinase [Anaerolineae bacterium]|nr:carbohydrate kinase [Anaerolineae bacterium]